MMSDQSHNKQEGIYQIHVKETLNEDWQEWFDGMTVSHHKDGGTMLTGYIIDQAQLFGILKKIRNLGLTLISVTRTDSHDNKNHK